MSALTCCLLIMICWSRVCVIVINLNVLQFYCYDDDFQFVHKQGCHRVGGILSGVSYCPGIECETCIGDVSYRIWELNLNPFPHSNVFHAFINGQSSTIRCVPNWLKAWSRCRSSFGNFVHCCIDYETRLCVCKSVM